MATPEGALNGKDNVTEFSSPGPVPESSEKPTSHDTLPPRPPEAPAGVSGILAEKSSNKSDAKKTEQKTEKESDIIRQKQIKLLQGMHSDPRNPIEFNDNAVNILAIRESLEKEREALEKEKATKGEQEGQAQKHALFSLMGQELVKVWPRAENPDEITDPKIRRAAWARCQSLLVRLEYILSGPMVPEFLERVRESSGFEHKLKDGTMEPIKSEKVAKSIHDFLKWAREEKGAEMRGKEPEKYASEFRQFMALLPESAKAAELRDHLNGIFFAEGIAPAGWRDRRNRAQRSAVDVPENLETSKLNLEEKAKAWDNVKTRNELLSEVDKISAAGLRVAKSGGDPKASEHINASDIKTRIEDGFKKLTEAKKVSPRERQRVADGVFKMLPFYEPLRRAFIRVGEAEGLPLSLPAEDIGRGEFEGEPDVIARYFSGTRNIADFRERVIDMGTDRQLLEVLGRQRCEELMGQVYTPLLAWIPKYVKAVEKISAEKLAAFGEKFIKELPPGFQGALRHIVDSDIGNKLNGRAAATAEKGPNADDENALEKMVKALNEEHIRQNNLVKSALLANADATSNAEALTNAILLIENLRKSLRKQRDVLPGMQVERATARKGKKGEVEGTQNTIIQRANLSVFGKYGKLEELLSEIMIKQTGTEPVDPKEVLEKIRAIMGVEALAGSTKTAKSESKPLISNDELEKMGLGSTVEYESTAKPMTNEELKEHGMEGTGWNEGKPTVFENKSETSGTEVPPTPATEETAGEERIRVPNPEDDLHGFLAAQRKIWAREEARAEKAAVKPAPAKTSAVVPPTTIKVESPVVPAAPPPAVEVAATPARTEVAPASPESNPEIWTLEEINSLTFDDLPKLSDAKLKEVIDNSGVSASGWGRATIGIPEGFFARVHLYWTTYFRDSEGEFLESHKYNSSLKDRTIQNDRAKIIKRSTEELRKKFEQASPESIEPSWTRAEIEALTFDKLHELGEEKLTSVIKNSGLSAGGWGIAIKNMPGESIENKVRSIFARFPDGTFLVENFEASFAASHTTEEVGGKQKTAIENVKKSLLGKIVQ